MKSKTKQTIAKVYQASCRANYTEHLCPDLISQIKRNNVDAKDAAMIPSRVNHYYFQALTSEVLSDIINSQPIAFTGHASTGKTSLIEQIAAECSQPLVKVNLNGNTTVGQFLGRRIIEDGKLKWQEGILPKAMKRGYWLILDEMDYAESDILCILNSVMQKEDPTLFVAENDDEIIKANSNFRVFVTGNTIGPEMGEYYHLYSGSKQLNHALLDRLSIYKVDFLTPAQEGSILFDAFNGSIPEGTLGHLCSIAAQLRDAYKNQDDLNSLENNITHRMMRQWCEKIVFFKPRVKQIMLDQENASGYKIAFSNQTKEDLKSGKEVAFTPKVLNAKEKDAGLTNKEGIFLIKHSSKNAIGSKLSETDKMVFDTIVDTFLGDL